VRWLRVLLTAGVVRVPRGIAQPGHLPVPQPPTPPGRGPAPSPLRDINGLGDALGGGGKPATSADLLQELSRTLDWLSWRPDWLRVHVRALWFATRCRLNGLPDETAGQYLADAVGVARDAVETMQANPTTPPRILAEDRARLKRLAQMEAKRPPAP
jgi:hypothetical protein